MISDFLTAYRFDATVHPFDCCGVNVQGNASAGPYDPARVVRPCTGILAPEYGKRQRSDGLYNRLNCISLTVNII